MMLPTPDGDPTPGFQVHLGGGLASDSREEAGLGRTVRGLKVYVEDLPDYVERVVRKFVADHTEGQTFAEWAFAADEEDSSERTPDVPPSAPTTSSRSSPSPAPPSSAGTPRPAR